MDSGAIVDAVMAQSRRARNRRDAILLRCDECGRFIAWADFDSGAARRSMTQPDNEFGGEEYETLCAKHNQAATLTPHRYSRAGGSLRGAAGASGGRGRCGAAGMICPTCNGSGREYCPAWWDGVAECGTCRGSGRVRAAANRNAAKRARAGRKSAAKKRAQGSGAIPGKGLRRKP